MFGELINVLTFVLAIQQQTLTKINIMKTFNVTYTTFKGLEKTILVKAQNEKDAINNAKHLCATGSNFRNAIETTEVYVKPRLQGFSGRN